MRETHSELVPWEPGHSGRGFLVLYGEPSIHTFRYPLYHQQGADALGLHMDDSVLPFLISPAGEVHVYADRDVDGQSAEQVIAGLDDRLRPADPSDPDDFEGLWDEQPGEDDRSDPSGGGG